jgi:hypothetical protein
MRYLIYILAFILLTSEDCKKNKSGTDSQPSVDTVGKVVIPSCIQVKIDSIKKLPKWNPPAEVHQYSFRGKTVYLFSSDCCDFFNPLFDSVCNYICSPHGGITGKGDMQCPDFEKEARKIGVVWKDER